MLLFEVMSRDKSHGNVGVGWQDSGAVVVPAAVGQSMRTYYLHNIVPSIRIAQSR